MHRQRYNEKFGEPVDLFESAAQERLGSDAPLAARLRPTRLDEVVGQAALIGEGGPLRALINQGARSSVLLWGPPGTGKTTIARILSSSVDAHWVAMSAVSATVGDVRAETRAARERLGANGRRTLLFLDEIHRFNRAQQDSLLGAVEEGVLILVGATTENPHFQVNTPLLSRSLLLRLEPLSDDDLATLVSRAIASDLGLAQKFSIEPDASAHLVRLAAGDARSVLNALEWSALVAGQAGSDVISIDHVEAAVQSRRVAYDQSGDQHYDVVSAFIKSMRGSDPDAALHWMARMIHSGEDPRFICRRMVIFASEDIGNADPRALQTAVAAFQALEFVGMPEARINLSQAVTYLAQAPKSNAAYTAIEEALSDVARDEIGPVPAHLRDSSYRGAKNLGHGEGYKYPHDFSGALVMQNYFPDAVVPREYYSPRDSGYESQIADRMAARRRALDANAIDDDDSEGETDGGA